MKNYLTCFLIKKIRRKNNIENKIVYVVISIEEYNKLINEIRDLKNKNEELELHNKNMNESLKEYDKVDEIIKDNVYKDNSFDITYYQTYYNSLSNEFKKRGYNNTEQIDVFLRELSSKKDEEIRKKQNKEDGESKDE